MQRPQTFANKPKGSLFGWLAATRSERGTTQLIGLLRKLPTKTTTTANYEIIIHPIDKSWSSLSKGCRWHGRPTTFDMQIIVSHCGWLISQNVVHKIVEAKQYFVCFRKHALCTAQLIRQSVRHPETDRKNN